MSSIEFIPVTLQPPAVSVLHINSQANTSASDEQPSTTTMENNSSILPLIWSTNLFDFGIDEETCWWGFWCTCLLGARTAESFGVGKSCRIVTETIVIFVVILLLLLIPVVGIITAILGLSYLAYSRSQMRSAIREKLSYRGESLSDFLIHFCCLSSCGVCQEAREAKAYGLAKLDFCSGQPLSQLEEAHERAVGRLVDTASDVLLPQNGSLASHWRAVSQLGGWLTILSISCIGLYAVLLGIASSAPHAGIVLLIFVQPAVILYIFYWRVRRQYASLDMVLKMFFVGFWVSTTQSMLLEGLLQVVFEALFSLVLGEDIRKYAPNDHTAEAEAEAVTSGGISSFRIQLLQRVVQTMMASSSTAASDGGSAQSRSELQSHVVLLIIVLFLMSFVMAAGVEETMKHMALRNCLLNAPLRDPHSILVYLMTAALGFATAENIGYVVGSSSSTASPVPGASALMGELVVLGMRWLTPVHVICSVLQAVNMSKAALDIQQMSLFWVLFPAIAVHGSFDFILFMADALPYVYDIDEVTWLVTVLSLAILVVLGSLIWACVAFKRVQTTFESRWSTLRSDDDDDLVIRFA